MKQRYRDEIERLGWNIYEDEFCYEFSQQSPAGEDFSFAIEKDDIVRAVRQYARDFDADEHEEMWISMIHSVAGVPQSVRELIDDADNIQTMLDDLADALEKAKQEEERL